MNKFEEIKSLNAGIIITDKNNIILSHNMHAAKLLKVDISVGRSIKYYLPYISSMNLHIEDTQNTSLYIFGISNLTSISKSIFQGIESGIFITDISGKVLFMNNSIKKILKTYSNDIFSIFLNNNINISSFGIILKSKKEVSYEVKTSDSKKYSLKLAPVIDDFENIIMIYGIFSETQDDDNLKNQLKVTQSELEKYRFSSNDDIFKSEKPNLQLHSKSMTELYSILSNISNRDITILLLGKSGTGKSSIAKKIHTESLRRSNQFVTINCAALPESLIESELFGYDKGAFTGALSGGKKGLIEIADGGTLFIDEIGELPFHLQGKLLELVQEKTYRPVGSTTVKTADIRIITATNMDLYGLVSQKKFREDLYYRIAVAVINIPPLAEHPEDIKLLLDSFTLYFNKKYDINISLSADAKKILLAYNWPGNIRELEHILEFLMIRSNKSIIEATDLPMDIIRYSEQHSSSGHKTLLPLLGTPPSITLPDAKTLNNLVFDVALGNDTLADYMQQYEAFIVNEYYKLHKSSYKLAHQLSISQTKANRLIQKHCK
ncbi:MAG: sigma 54-interacting transcriptional regulator [Proteocatella sp.]